MKDYVLEYKHNGINYDVHLIDSPGFDDGSANDAEVLSRIATYVNTIYKLKHPIAGVLYLHDITKAKMGGVGIRNVRMLENMIGVDKWDNCTLVTTKWGCTKNPDGEAKREQKLETDPKFFKSMCENSKHARMTRFEGTKASALNIIKPHLGRKFSPAISLQMVDPKRPKLKLGETDAGRIVADGLEELLKSQERTAELAEVNKIFEQRFDEATFKDFKEKRDKLKQQHGLNRAGRWVARTVILGGGIAATIFTLGPGASAFALAPAFETVAISQKKAEKEQVAQLEADYKAETRLSSKLSQLGTGWLRDRKVKELKQLNSDEHSIASSEHTSLDSDRTRLVQEANARPRTSIDSTSTDSFLSH